MTQTPNDGSERGTDGWAAWDKKEGDTITPPTQGKLGSEPEKDETEDQPPAQ